MKNIQDFENVINQYGAQISAKKAEIENAERNLLVAQTELKSYQKQSEELEAQCVALTGKPTTELDSLITESMTKLQELMQALTPENQTVNNMQFSADSF